MSSNFNTIRSMVHDHLRDAAKDMGKDATNPGPTRAQCYASAFGTATGAYAGGGIGVAEWQQLHKEIREHQELER